MNASSERWRLRWLVSSVFVALTALGVVLITQAYRQVRFESFHQHRLLAEELTRRIDDELNALIAEEAARPFTDYRYLTVAGERYVQRSPLSRFPPRGLPGVVGHFQVDASGAFSTPLLPAGPRIDAAEETNLEQMGLTREEYEQRWALQQRLQALLAGAGRAMSGPQQHAEDATSARRATTIATPAEALVGALATRQAADAGVPADRVQPNPEGTPTGQQQLFDELERAAPTRSLGSVTELKLDARVQVRGDGAVPGSPGSLQRKRLETNRAVASSGPASPRTEPRITMFESEVDPFAWAVLDADHFVMFRNVWRDGQRFVQGAIVAQSGLLRTIEAGYRASVVSRTSDLVVAYDDQVLSLYSAEGSRQYQQPSEHEGELLYQAPLSTPLSRLSLIYSVVHLPPGSGAATLAWAAGAAGAVLCVGFLLIYRTGLRRIRLVEQQQDFVAAVSHELKTPLAAIRMYGEILQAGWADETRKRTYYEYILGESERLSRLITNVLQLARLSRGATLDVRATEVSVLTNALDTAMTSTVAAAGFELDTDYEPGALAELVDADADAFVQLMLNLVDNAIKFSSDTEPRRVRVGVRCVERGVSFCVRDYGPGIDPSQSKQIFQPFYRGGNELTRNTEGTGIGLSLVRQLATAMHAEVDVSNADPGAEFRVTLRRAARDGP